MTEHALVRAMRALDDVKDRLVVVGGTAHRLFLQHPLGADPGFSLLTTEDVDVAAPLELQHDGSGVLLERLIETGFTEGARGGAVELCFVDGRVAREASQIAASQRRVPPTSWQVAMACRRALPVALPFLR